MVRLKWGALGPLNITISNDCLKLGLNSPSYSLVASNGSQTDADGYKKFPTDKSIKVIWQAGNLFGPSFTDLFWTSFLDFSKVRKHGGAGSDGFR